MKKSRGELNSNEMQIPLLAFLESYNKNMPPIFPRASAAVLKKFQEAHPMLFKQSELWSIAKHRKRFMDWFSSHSDIA